MHDGPLLCSILTSFVALLRAPNLSGPGLQLHPLGHAIDIFLRCPYSVSEGRLGIKSSRVRLGTKDNGTPIPLEGRLKEADARVGLFNSKAHMHIVAFILSLSGELPAQVVVLMLSLGKKVL